MLINLQIVKSNEKEILFLITIREKVSKLKIPFGKGRGYHLGAGGYKFLSLPDSRVTGLREISICFLIRVEPRDEPRPFMGSGFFCILSGF